MREPSEADSHFESATPKTDGGYCRNQREAELSASQACAHSDRNDRWNRKDGLKVCNSR